MAELTAFFDNYLDTELSFEVQNRRLADAMIEWFWWPRTTALASDASHHVVG